MPSPSLPLPPAVAEAVWRGDALGRGTDTVWPSGTVGWWKQPVDSLG